MKSVRIVRRFGRKGGGGDAASQAQGTVFRPGQDQALQQQFNAVQQGGQQAQQNVQSAIQGLPSAPQLQQNFGQFFDPNREGTMDAVSQSQMGQMAQQRQGQLAAQGSQLQRQLGPAGGRLASVLGAQGQQLSALQGGQDAAQVQQGQLQRNMQNATMQSQLQQAGNAAQLDQFDARQSGAAMQANLGNLLAQIPQSTLASLFGTAQGMGQQFAASPGEATGGQQLGIGAQGQSVFNPTPPPTQRTTSFEQTQRDSLRRAQQGV